MFAGLASLGLALIAVFLYGYAVINNQVIPPCPEPEPEHDFPYGNNTCPGKYFLASIFLFAISFYKRTRHIFAVTFMVYIYF